MNAFVKQPTHISSELSIEQQVKALLISGKSQRAIALELRISRQKVAQWVQQIETASKEEPDTPFGPSDYTSPTMNRAEAIAELVALSTRPEGVRNSEMHHVLSALFGHKLNPKTNRLELGMTANQLRYLKKSVLEAATAQSLSALFVPEWMPRQQAQEANAILVRLAGALNDAAQEALADFMLAFPGTSSHWIFSELFSLAFHQASKEPIETRCERNRLIAQELDNRQGTVRQSIRLYQPQPIDTHSELDSICI